jgi:outer membrane protein assembly factor BamB
MPRRKTGTLNFFGRSFPKKLSVPVFRRTLSVPVLALLSVAAVDAQWPQWRGPGRDGIAPAALVPDAWPEQPVQQWTQPVGEGYSSPVVDGGRVFVHSRRDPEEIVTALDLGSGKVIWTEKYAAPFAKNKYAASMAKGPFSTPLVSGGRLFTLGVTGVLSAFDAPTGKPLWRRDWSKEVDTSKLFTGTAMSPIVDGGLLIVHVGDDSSGAFRALDPATGAEKWSLPGYGPGYASPIVMTVAGTRQLVTMTDKAVVGVDPAAGKLLWQIPFPDEWNENIVTPAVAGDVLVVSGTRKGTFGYRVERGAGGWDAKQVWHNADLPMYMSTPVADGTFVYGFSSRRKGQLFALDAATGKAAWTTEGRAGQNASIVSAGPNLVVLTNDGDLIVVKRSPERFEELRRYKVSQSPTWSHPVLLGGQLIIRDAESVTLWQL